MTALKNKLKITAEAKIDLEDMEQLDIAKVKMEVEKKIESKIALPHNDYFCIKYTDGHTLQNIKLFIRKGNQTESIQQWDLIGICEADGLVGVSDLTIRKWLNTKVKNIPYEPDFVKLLRKKQASQENKYIKIYSLPIAI